MNEKDERKKLDSAFYMKIDSELKKQFNIKCLENGDKMAEVLKEHIKEYIRNN